MPRITRTAVWVSALVVVATVTTAHARQHAAVKATKSACSHRCTHVDDCPKVTCQCAEASASGVAACDAAKTHCCTSPNTACARFCEAHHQKWTGKFTPESDAEPPSATAAPADSGSPNVDGTASHDAEKPADSEGASTSHDASSSAAGAECDERCDKPEECHPMTCQCAHAIAESVAACDEHTHCCGSARIVCQHFCSGKKGKWTGKVADASPPPESAPDAPDDEGGEDDGSGGGSRDGYYLAP